MQVSGNMQPLASTPWTCHVSCKVANSWAGSSWANSCYWHTSIRHWTTIRHYSSWTLDVIKGACDWACTSINSNWSLQRHACIWHWTTSWHYSSWTNHVINRTINWAGCRAVSCHWHTCIRHWASSSIHSTSTVHMIFWALDWAHAWALGSIMAISRWHTRVSNHASIGTSHWTLIVVRGTNSRANAWALGSISSNRTCH